MLDSASVNSISSMPIKKIIIYLIGFCTFSGIPVEESLSSEHSGELLSNSFEHLLDGGGVSNEGHGHLKTLGGNITNG